MRIGLLGGTFDPLHNGHLRLAVAARRQQRLDRVFLVLSPRSPFKLHRKLTSVPKRLRAVALTVRGRKGISLGKWELNRRGPSYTATTLRALHRLHPTWDLYLILGSDTYAGFARWKDPQTILRLARILVGRRPGAASVRVSSRNHDQIKILHGVFPDISSTKIRNLLKTKPAMVRRLVPRPVFDLLVNSK